MTRALSAAPLRRYFQRNSSGSLAMFAAMRRASSRVSNLAADPGLFVGGFGRNFLWPRKVAAAGQKCDRCGGNNPKP